MAEAIEASAVLALREQARVEQVLFGVATPNEMLEGVVEALRRVAQPKGLDSGVGQPALLAQIVQHVRTVEKMRAIKDQCIFKQFAEMVVSLPLFRLLGPIGGQFHTGPRRKFLKCFFEINPLRFSRGRAGGCAQRALSERWQT